MADDRILDLRSRSPAGSNNENFQQDNLFLGAHWKHLTSCSNAPSGIAKQNQPSSRDPMHIFEKYHSLKGRGI